MSSGWGLGPAQRFLLVLIGVLLVIWWFTRPDDTTVSPISTMETDYGSSSLRWETWPRNSDGPTLQARPLHETPPWMSNIDTSRPECVKALHEILEQREKGGGMDLIYIGDCDKRLKAEN
ncbi:MAG: hypothetical protein AAGL66_18595 [Pseudomonadota bacterium]